MLPKVLAVSTSDPTFINGSLWVNWHERRIANGSGKNCWMPFLEQAPFGCFGARFEGWAENRVALSSVSKRCRNSTRLAGGAQSPVQVAAHKIGRASCRERV